MTFYLKTYSQVLSAFGRVLEMDFTISDSPPKFIPIDEQANDRIVHLD